MGAPPPTHLLLFFLVYLSSCNAFTSISLSPAQSQSLSPPLPSSSSSSSTSLSVALGFPTQQLDQKTPSRTLKHKSLISFGVGTKNGQPELNARGVRRFQVQDEDALLRKSVKLFDGMERDNRVVGMNEERERAEQRGKEFDFDSIKERPFTPKNEANNYGNDVIDPNNSAEKKEKKEMRNLQSYILTLRQKPNTLLPAKQYADWIPFCELNLSTPQSPTSKQPPSLLLPKGIQLLKREVLHSFYGHFARSNSSPQFNDLEFGYEPLADFQNHVYNGKVFGPQEPSQATGRIKVNRSVEKFKAGVISQCKKVSPNLRTGRNMVKGKGGEGGVIKELEKRYILDGDGKILKRKGVKPSEGTEESASASSDWAEEYSTETTEKGSGLTNAESRKILNLSAEENKVSALKKAYRKMSLDYHPDRFVPTDEKTFTTEEIKVGAKKFNLIKRAYEELVANFDEVTSTSTADDGSGTGSRVGRKSWYEGLGGRSRIGFVKGVYTYGAKGPPDEDESEGKGEAKAKGTQWREGAKGDTGEGGGGGEGDWIVAVKPLDPKIPLWFMGRNANR